MARKKEPDRGAETGRDVTTSMQIARPDLELLQDAMLPLQRRQGGRASVSAVLAWLIDENRDRLRKLIKGE